jgi:hypothetical protein
MSDNWQVVFRAENMLEAALVKSRLEDAGISVMERGEAMSAAFGFSVGPLATVDLLVPKAQLQAALEIVSEPEGEPGSPDELV